VAHNAATEGPDCFNFQGHLIDAGFNLEDDAAGSCGFRTASHDLVGVDPLLRALGAYGGGVLTEPPLPTSPVINAGPHTVCPTTTDERAVPRPQGPGGACDIGAVEVARPRPVSLTPSSGSEGGGLSVRVTGSGFTLTTAVRFNQTPVRFHVINDTTIALTTPPGHGVAQVRMASTDGPSVANLTFRYDPPPPS
jgi:IPT/TIG domain